MVDVWRWGAGGTASMSQSQRCNPPRGEISSDDTARIFGWSSGSFPPRGGGGGAAEWQDRSHLDETEGEKGAPNPGGTASHCPLLHREQRAVSRVVVVVVVVVVLGITINRHGGRDLIVSGSLHHRPRI